MRLEPHSTRLFPKNEGAHAYRLTGIAARCDWVILSDRQAPELRLIRRHPTGTPETVFLSLRSPFEALAHMAQQVLPMLSGPFVLVSGSEDVTLPRQLDHRWRRFNAQERRWIDDILGHPLLCRWFVENLDQGSHPKMTPLPVGMVFAQGPAAEALAAPDAPPLGGRPLRVLCAHRDRPGPQWETRRRVTQMARSHWGGFCNVLDEEVPEPDFLALVEQHAFVLCVEGGGLDPSPKAWQALLHGAIPIVRDSPLRAAYELLPVAFVPDWAPAHLDPERLRAWRDEMQPLQDQPGHRREVLRRLSLDFWWGRVRAALAPTVAGIRAGPTPAAGRHGPCRPAASG